MFVHSVSITNIKAITLVSPQNNKHTLY